MSNGCVVGTWWNQQEGMWKEGTEGEMIWGLLHLPEVTLSDCRQWGEEISEWVFGWVDRGDKVKRQTLLDTEGVCVCVCVGGGVFSERWQLQPMCLIPLYLSSMHFSKTNLIIINPSPPTPGIPKVRAFLSSKARQMLTTDKVWNAPGVSHF